MRLWISLLPQTIHKTDETSGGPFYLRGCVSTVFINDTLMMVNSEEKCVRNVKNSLALF